MWAPKEGMKTKSQAILLILQSHPPYFHGIAPFLMIIMLLVSPLLNESACNCNLQLYGHSELMLNLEIMKTGKQYKHPVYQVFLVTCRSLYVHIRCFSSETIWNLKIEKKLYEASSHLFLVWLFSEFKISSCW